MLFDLAAEQGHWETQNLRGCACLHANDFLKAIDFLKKSADQGFALAQYNLGMLYVDGKMTQNLPMAVHYIEKAASQGLAEAQCDMGYFYKKGGYGVAQDYATAFKYYQMAAVQGNANAIYNLGLAYEWVKV